MRTIISINQKTRTTCTFLAWTMLATFAFAQSEVRQPAVRAYYQAASPAATPRAEFAPASTADAWDSRTIVPVSYNATPATPTPEDAKAKAPERAPLPLGSRKSNAKGSLSPFGQSGDSNAKGEPDKKTSQLITMGGSLAAVLGLFFLFAWVLRRSAPKGQGALPREAIETLGRAPLSSKQFVHLIRIGSKMILVNVTPDGAKTLTEITDPAEVDHLAGLCEQSKSGSSSEAFRRVFQSFAPKKPAEAEYEYDESEGQHV